MHKGRSRRTINRYWGASLNVTHLEQLSGCIITLGNLCPGSARGVS